MESEEMTAYSERVSAVDNSSASGPPPQPQQPAPPILESTSNSTSNSSVTSLSINTNLVNSSNNVPFTVVGGGNGNSNGVGIDSCGGNGSGSSNSNNTSAPVVAAYTPTSATMSGATTPTTTRLERLRASHQRLRVSVHKKLAGSRKMLQYGDPNAGDVMPGSTTGTGTAAAPGVAALGGIDDIGDGSIAYSLSSNSFSIKDEIGGRSIIGTLSSSIQDDDDDTTAMDVSVGDGNHNHTPHYLNNDDIINDTTTTSADNHIHNDDINDENNENIFDFRLEGFGAAATPRSGVGTMVLSTASTTTTPTTSAPTSPQHVKLVHQENDSLKRQLVYLNKEKQRLHEELTETRDELETTRRTLRQLSTLDREGLSSSTTSTSSSAADSISTPANIIHSLRMRNRALTSRLDHLESVNATLQEQTHTLLNRYPQYRDVTLSTTTPKAKTDPPSLTFRHQQQQGQLNQHQQEQQKELEETFQLNKRLTDFVEQLTNKISQLEIHNHRLVDELHTVKEDGKVKDQRLAELTLDLKDSTTRESTLKGELDLCRGRLQLINVKTDDLGKDMTHEWVEAKRRFQNLAARRYRYRLSSSSSFSSSSTSSNRQQQQQQQQLSTLSEEGGALSASLSSSSLSSSPNSPFVSQSSSTDEKGLMNSSTVLETNDSNNNKKHNDDDSTDPIMMARSFGTAGGDEISSRNGDGIVEDGATTREIPTSIDQQEVVDVPDVSPTAASTPQGNDDAVVAVPSLTPNASSSSLHSLHSIAGYASAPSSASASLAIVTVQLKQSKSRCTELENELRNMKRQFNISEAAADQRLISNEKQLMVTQDWLNKNLAVKIRDLQQKITERLKSTNDRLQDHVTSLEQDKEKERTASTSSDGTGNADGDADPEGGKNNKADGSVVKGTHDDSFSSSTSSDGSSTSSPSATKKSSLTIVSAQLAEARAKYVTLEVELDDIQAKFTDITDELESIQQDHLKDKENLTSAVELNKHLLLMVDILETRVRELVELNEEMIKEQQEQRHIDDGTNVDDRNDFDQELREVQLLQKSKENLSIVTKQLVKAQKRNTSLESELKLLKEKVQSMEEREEYYVAQELDLENSRLVTLDLTKRMKELVDRANELEVVKTKLTKQLRKRDEKMGVALEMERQMQRGSISIVSTQLAETNLRNATMEKELQDVIEELNTITGRLHEAIVEAEERDEFLATNERDLESTRLVNIQLTEQVSQLNDKIKELNVQNQDLVDQLRTFEEREGSMEEEIRVQKQIRRSSVSIVSTQLAESNLRKAAVDAELEEVKERLEFVTEQLHAAHETIEERDDFLAAGERDLEASRLMNVELNDQINSLRQANDSMSRNVQYKQVQMDVERNMLRESISVVTNQLSETTTLVQTMEDELEDVKKTLNNTLAIAEERAEALEACERDLESSRLISVKLDEHVDDLTNQKLSLEKDKDDLIRRFEELIFKSKEDEELIQQMKDDDKERNELLSSTEHDLEVSRLVIIDLNDRITKLTNESQDLEMTIKELKERSVEQENDKQNFIQMERQIHATKFAEANLRYSTLKRELDEVYEKLQTTTNDAEEREELLASNEHHLEVSRLVIVNLNELVTQLDEKTVALEKSNKELSERLTTALADGEAKDSTVLMERQIRRSLLAISSTQLSESNLRYSALESGMNDMKNKLSDAMIEAKEREELLASNEHDLEVSRLVIVDLNNRVTDLTETNQELATQHKDMSERLSKAIAGEEEKEKALRMNYNEQIQATVRFTTIEDELKETKRQLENANKELTERLSIALADGEEKENVAEMERQLRRSSIAISSTQLSESNLRVSSLESDVNDLKNKLNDAMVEAKEHEELLSSFERAMEASRVVIVGLNDRVTELTKSKQALEETNKDLSGRLSNALANNEEKENIIQTKSNELVASNERCSMLEEDLKKTKEGHEELTERLSTALADGKEKGNMLQMKQKQLDESTLRCSMLEITLNETRDSLNIMTVDKVERDDLLTSNEHDLEVSRLVIIDLNNQVTDLTKSKKELEEQLSAAIADKDDAIQMERQMRRSSLAISSTQLSESNLRYSALEADMDDMKEKLDQVTEEAEERERELHSSRLINVDLTNEAEQLKEANHGLEVQIRQLNEENQKMEESKRRLEDELEDSKHEGAKKEMLVQTERQVQRGSVSILSTQLAMTNLRNSALEIELQEAHEKIDAIVNEAEEHQEVSAARDKDLKHARRRNVTLSEQVAELSSKNDKLVASNKKMSQSLKTHAKEISQSRAQTLRLADELERMTALYRRLEGENSQLEEKIRDLTSVSTSRDIHLQPQFQVSSMSIAPSSSSDNIVVSRSGPEIELRDLKDKATAAVAQGTATSFEEQNGALNALSMQLRQSRARCYTLEDEVDELERRFESASLEACEKEEFLLSSERELDYARSLNFSLTKRVKDLKEKTKSLEATNRELFELVVEHENEERAANKNSSAESIAEVATQVQRSSVVMASTKLAEATARCTALELELEEVKQAAGDSDDDADISVELLQSLEYFQTKLDEVSAESEELRQEIGRLRAERDVLAKENSELKRSDEEGAGQAGEEYASRFELERQISRSSLAIAATKLAESSALCSSLQLELEEFKVAQEKDFERKELSEFYKTELAATQRLNRNLVARIEELERQVLDQSAEISSISIAEGLDDNMSRSDPAVAPEGQEARKVQASRNINNSSSSSNNKGYAVEDLQKLLVKNERELYESRCRGMDLATKLADMHTTVDELRKENQTLLEQLDTVQNGGNNTNDIPSIQSQLKEARGRETYLTKELSKCRSEQQQDRHLVSCLSTELQDSTSREYQLRDELAACRRRLDLISQTTDKWQEELHESGRKIPERELPIVEESQNDERPSSSSSSSPPEEKYTAVGAFRQNSARMSSKAAPEETRNDSPADDYTIPRGRGLAGPLIDADALDNAETPGSSEGKKEKNLVESLNKDLADQVEHLQARVRELEETASSQNSTDQRSAGSRLQERYKEMKRSLDSVAMVLQEVTEANQLLTARIAELESELNITKAKNEHLEYRKKTLENEGRLQRTSITAMSTRLSETNSKNTSLQDEIQELKKQVEAEMTEKLADTAAIEGELQEARKYNDDMMSKLEKLERAFTQLVKERQTLIADQEHLAVAVEDGRFALAASQKEVDDAKEREAALQAKYDSCLAEMNAVKEEMKEMEAVKEASIGETHALKADLEEARKERDDQQFCNGVFKDIISKLNEMNDDLEVRHKKMSEENTFLRTKNKNFTQNIANLQDLSEHLKHNEGENGTSSLIEEVKFLRTQKKGFLRTIANLEAQLSRAVRQREVLGDQEKKMAERIEALEVANNDLQKQLRSVDATHAKKFEAAMTRTKWLDGQLGKAQQTIVDLARKTKSMRQAHTAEVEQVRTGEVRMTKEVMILRAKCEKLRGKSTRQEKELAKLEEEMEGNEAEARKVIDKLREKVRGLQSRLVILETTSFETDRENLKQRGQ